MKLFRSDLPKPPYWPPQTDPHAIATALHYVRHRDPYGNVIHQLLAMLFCFTLPLSTAGSGIAFALLAAYALIRTPNTWRCYNPLLCCASLGAVILFVGWYALSITWSSDTTQGLDELAAARVMALPIMLWPVIDKSHWYIAAALVGVAAQNVVQTLQFFELLDYAHGASGRLGGWVHPIHAGAWCAAAMCWHSSAVLTARPLRWRVLSGVGLLVAGAGLIATGSRGPWIAAAVGLPVLVLVVIIHRPTARKATAALVGAGLLAMVVGFVAAHSFLHERVSEAFDEYDAAVERDEYWTSTGSRIAFWSWAVDIWKTAPIIGPGAGSFPNMLHDHPQYQQTVDRARLSAVRELPGYQLALGDDEVKALPGYDRALHTGQRRVELYLEHDHAHSTYFHTLAAAGAVGLLLLLLMLALIARQCTLDPPTHPYVDGTIAALAVWVIGAQFDCYHLNGHLFGMLALILTVTLPNRVLIEEPS